MKTFSYQNKKNRNYFEGWYYRITDAKNDVNVAIIFAVTKDTKNPHSFIQYYDGHQKKAYYYRFDSKEFRYDATSETVFIAQNELSFQHVKLYTDNVQIEATNRAVKELQPYNGHSSAMGFLENAPLECFQEVLFLHGETDFIMNGVAYTGTSYMEKTYGTNFPTQWIWLQSSHSQKGSLISFSLGKVPVFLFEMKGFFLILRIGNIEHRFGTYNRSKIRIDVSTKTHTTFSIRRGNQTVIITAVTQHPVELVGPRKKGKMDLPVYESLNATATLKFFEGNQLVFEDEFEHVGLELMY